MSTPDMEWMGDGACVGQPLDLFFPDKDNTAQQREAKAWCALCPVVLECLTFALRHGQAGVWGNTTDAERKRIRRTERLPVVQPLGDPIEHGTAAGARAHHRRNESPCERCRRAAATYRREGGDSRYPVRVDA